MAEMLEIDDVLEFLESREGFYKFLASVYDSEITEEMLEQMAVQPFAISSGSDDVSRGYRLLVGYLGNGNDMKIPDLNADFASVFLGAGAHELDRSAPPYESVYTSESGMLMQESRDEVVKLYYREHLDVERETEIPEDHLAFELQFMSILMARARSEFEQARAAEGDGHAHLVEALRLLVAADRFLADHLATWVPLLCADVLRLANTDFYRAFALITRGFVCHENEYLRGIVLTFSPDMEFPEVVFGVEDPAAKATRAASVAAATQAAIGREGDCPENDACRHAEVQCACEHGADADPQGGEEEALAHGQAAVREQGGKVLVSGPDGPAQVTLAPRDADFRHAYMEVPESSPEVASAEGMTSEEKAEDLFKRMAFLKRSVFIPTLEYCLEARCTDDLLAFIAGQQENRRSAYTGYDIVSMLADADCLVDLNGDGRASLYVEEGKDPTLDLEILREDDAVLRVGDIGEGEIVFASAQDVRKRREPPAWMTTDTGQKLITHDNPLDMIEKLFAADAKFVPGYEKTLRMIGEGQGKFSQIEEMIKATDFYRVDNRHASAFLKKLEEAGAIEWRGHEWGITSAGKKILADLAPKA